MRMPKPAQLVALAAVVATGLSLNGSSAVGSAATHAVDVTSVAIATAASPNASDSAFDVGRLGGGLGSSEVTSTAVSDCDDCAATSVSVGVVYGDAPRPAQADNAASAWSSGCTNCASASVSVQVVVLRRPSSITVNNRSLAANAACAGCSASSAAFQLVLVSPHGNSFGRDDIAELRDWAQALAEGMTAASPTAQLRSSAAPDGDHQLAELELRAKAALGDATTLKRDVDVHSATG